MRECFSLELLPQANFCGHQLHQPHCGFTLQHRICTQTETGLWLALILAIGCIVLHVGLRGLYRYVTKSEVPFWLASVGLAYVLGHFLALLLWRLLPKPLKHDLFNTVGDSTKYPVLKPFRIRGKSPPWDSQAH